MELVYYFSGHQTEFVVERCLGRGLGVVIINLQQTKYDGAASLRIFSPSDQVMSLLTEGLQLRYSPARVR